MNIKDKIKKIIIILTLISTFFMFGGNKASAAENNVKLQPLKEVYMTRYSVYSTLANKSLISKEENETNDLLALIKIMSAIVAVQNADLTVDQVPKDSELVTVGKEINALPDNYKSAGFRIGDIVSLPDLIRAMIINSSDDAAIVIAVYIGRKKLGGTPDPKYQYDKVASDYFLSLMNKEVNLMGLTHTTFDNPVGVADRLVRINSHSTTYDMAKISAKFLSNKFLNEISRIATYKYWDYDESNDDETVVKTPAEEARTKPWQTDNLMMIPEDKYYSEYCTGIMASTSGDWMDIVVHVNYRDIDLIITAIGVYKYVVYSDIASLLDYVFNNYIMHTFVEEGEIIADYFVENAMDPSNEHLIVRTGGGGKYITRIDKLSSFGTVMRMDSKYFKPMVNDLNEKYIYPSAEITKGTILGTLDIYYDSNYIATTLLYAGNTVPVYLDLPVQAGKKWYKNIEWKKFLLILVIFAIIIFILIQIVFISNKIKRQKIIRKKYAPKRAEYKNSMTSHYSKKKTK